jgi:hybrid cluster-associated redox disulfide protein
MVIYVKKMKKITKDTILSEIMSDEKSQKILAKYNLPCLSCPFAKMEMEKLKLGDVCQMYGLDQEGLLKELNELK